MVSALQRFHRTLYARVSFERDFTAVGQTVHMKYFVVAYLIPALSGSDDSKRGQGYVAHFCLQSVLDGKQERHDTGIQGRVTFDPFTSS